MSFTFAFFKCAYTFITIFTYKRYFFNTQQQSCVIDHELEHARGRSSHVGSTYGKQKILYGIQPTMDKINIEMENDFEKIAIQTRKEMDQVGFTRFFEKCQVLLEIFEKNEWREQILYQISQIQKTYLESHSGR